MSDRVIVYPGQIPLETDILNTNKNSMVGLSKLSAAILGTTTLVNGFTCIPTGPASLQVQVTAGEIYSLQNTDSTAYSTLAADTVNQLIKQGIQLGTVTLSAPAPATGGQSINYLVQVTYQDSDLLPVVLPYYNASNPSQAYSGPANAGTTNNTVRKGLATVGIKTGISAATGSQVTPTADAGYTALFVVSVANGQTQITAPNIVNSGLAPFISETLTQKISQASGDLRYIQLANFATAADAQAQTNTIKPLSPAGLSLALQGGNQSISANGYQKLPGGVIIQWGQVGGVGVGGTTATYAIAFPNNAFVTVPYVSVSTGPVTQFVNSVATATPKSTIIFALNTGTAAVGYIAIGN